MRLRAWLVLLCALWLAGCAEKQQPADIRFAIAQAPLTLDPRYATDAASERVNRLIYRALVDFDAHYRPVPALAGWQCPDALHCRFTLGKQAGRTFHDGTPLTADDVAATYRSLLTLKDSPHSAEFANIAGVEAVDADTVDFTLKVPDAQFPARLIIGILPAKLIAQNHDFARHPLGSGPLRFVSWNGALKLERIADRQSIVLEEVRDPTVRILKLLRGEADLLQGDLPPELVAYLKHQSGIAVRESPAPTSPISASTCRTRCCKIRWCAVPWPRPSIAARSSVMRLVGGSRPAAAILPPEHWAGNPDLAPYPYNPAQARALLQQAGVQLPLKLVYKTSTDAQRVRLATMMQAQMRAAGIELEIRSLDWGTFFDDIKHGKFQLYGLTWVGIKTPEIYRLAFHSASVPPAGANRGRLQDAELDELIERQDWQGGDGALSTSSCLTCRCGTRASLSPCAAAFPVMRRQPDGNWDGLASVKRN